LHESPFCAIKKAGYSSHTNTQPTLILVLVISALTDSKHFSPAYGTDALSRRLSILHGYSLGILHFSLGPAFHTVRLHLFSSLLYLP